MTPFALTVMIFGSNQVQSPIADLKNELSGRNK